MDRVGFEPTASRKLQMQSVRANHCATCPLHKAMVSGIKKPSVHLRQVMAVSLLLS